MSLIKMTGLVKNNLSLLLGFTLLSLFFIPVSTSVLIPIVFIFLLFLTGIYKEKLILTVIILGYLAASNQTFPEYRVFITAFVTLILSYLFLRKYGFQFENYAKVPRQVLVYVILLTLTLVISTTFSLNISASFVVTVRMIFFIIICYLLYSFLDDKSYIYLYIYSIISVMVILGMRMVIDYLNLGAESFFIRSILSDKSDLYGMVANTGLTIYFISISLITGLFFINKFISKNKKLFLLFLFAFNIVVLILANSRGGIIAAFLSIIFILFVLNKPLLLKMSLTVITAGILLLLILPGLSETADLYLRWHTIGEREAYWKMGLEVISDYPVFGLGPGLFADYFYNYASSSHISFFNNPGIEMGSPHPHNFFLYFTAENGILGLVTSISFFILFFYIAFKTMKLTRQNKEYFVLSTVITGIGIGVFFKSFFEVSGYLIYGYITTDLPFWLIFGILIFIYKRNDSAKPGLNSVS